MINFHRWRIATAVAILTMLVGSSWGDSGFIGTDFGNYRERWACVVGGTGCAGARRSLAPSNDERPCAASARICESRASSPKTHWCCK